MREPDHSPEDPASRPNLSDQMVVRLVGKMFIPYFLVFGFYIIAHGEIGPGGGFQGGVVIAAGYILYCLIFGREAGHQFLPPRAVERIMALGVLLYAGVGVLGFFLGNAFLDYRAVAALIGAKMDAGEALSMTIIETGVGFTVAAVMVTIYDMVTEEDA